ncbi:MAG: hypothetical protein GX558_09830 [Clostridiales bacterium]|nr:hypothetical protein [Clostridiales bacterium]
MSFFSYKNANSSACPGTVAAATACNGLTERVCVQLKNVYDACMQQEQLDDQVVTVTDIVPVLGAGGGCGSTTNRTCSCTCNGPSCDCVCGACGSNTPISHSEAVENAANCTCVPQPVGNWSFESCRSSTTAGTITNLTIERLCDRPQFARVRGTVNVPIDVLFVDANCQEWLGRGNVSVVKDVLLAIPDESIVPFTLDSLVSAICVTGTYIGNCRFRITICVTIVLKILAEVELMIPAYGFCQIPPCEEFAENVCDEFFSLPLFPRQVNCLTADDVAPGSICANNGSTAGATNCMGGCTSVCSSCGTTCGARASQCPRCGCAMTSRG